MGPPDSLDDIAIIGFALKFPGEATNSTLFWKMLIDGSSTMTDVPKNRFNIDSFCGTKEEKSGTFDAKGGNFINEDIAAFDAAFFSINPTEAKCMDPQQRLLLEVAYHSLENSGLSLEDIRGSNTSVFVGSFMRDYEIMLSKDPDLPAKYRMSGTSVAMLANRLSWFYDLRGPSISLDTACSSSLTALHLACQSLRTGESTMGLVAGSNLVFGPESSIGLSDMNFLSPDSKCHSFDQRANGYARGEGIGVVIIKTVREAIKDGNTIRSIIRASGSNQDGKTPGITQPNAEAQESLIRQTYNQAGLDMASTRYFEAHGTGTSLGDPMEARAIANAFKGSRSHQDPLYIGAVKSNIGHLEGASGVAGLIKAILVLENGVIPPIANLEKLNPKIPADDWNLVFPTSITPWPTNGIRRASLNSFGFGGANVHVVLDDAYHYLRSRGIQGIHHTQNIVSAINHINRYINLGSPGHDTESMISNGRNTGCHKLLVWSASDENSLTRLTSAFESYLTSEISLNMPVDISDVAYTLGEKRSSLPWKSYAVVDEERPSWSELKTKTSSPIRGHKSPRLGFVFTGQGAQWYAMGHELMASPIFSSSIEAADHYLRGLGCTWSLIEELTQRDEQSSKIECAEYGQPASTALQVALVDLLTDWKIHPSVVVGHSSGEIAAAYCAGGISREAAWKIAYFRGVATASAVKASCEKGGMLSVGISADDVKPYLQDPSTVTIGCINSPKSITLSGPSVDIDVLQKMFEKDKIFCRKLKVNVAYHSKYMQEVASVYEPLICDLQPGSTSDCVMISSVTGKQIPLNLVTKASYWIENMVSTVRFSDAVSRICTRAVKKQLGKSKTQNLSVDYILEIGPHSTLQGPIRDIISKAGRQKDIRYATALIRGVNAQSSILQAVGNMHCFGFLPDISNVNDSFATDLRDPKFLVDLPNYPFNHDTRYWLESRVSKNYRFCEFAYHELLGRRVDDWNPLEARWQHRIILSDNPWVKDHIVNGTVLYPAAGMLVMAIEAARQLSIPDKKIVAYRMKDISVIKGLVIPSVSEGVEVQLYLRPSHDTSTRMQENNWNEFRICFYDDGKWVENCRGAISVEYESENGEIGLPRVMEESNRYGQEYEEESRLCKTPLSSKKMYKFFESFGFSYGRSFRPIQDVFFNEGGHATAKLNLNNWRSTIADKDIQPHVIHPTTLDGILQLAFPAFTKGCGVLIPTMVPTLIKNLWISNLESTPDNIVKVSMKAAERGYRGTSAKFRAVHASTKIACIAGDFEMTYVSSTIKPNGGDESGKYYNLDWKPDVTLLEHKQLAAICTAVTDAPRSVEELMAEEKESLCLKVMASTLKDLDVGNSQLPPHLLRYVQWMEHQVLSKDPNTDDIDKYSLEILLQRIESCDAEGQVIARVSQNLESILKGKLDPLELLFGDNLLQSYYLHAHNAPFIFRKVQKYIDALAHKTSDLKVLEIGAGTGGATSYVLDALMSYSEDGGYGTPRFVEYIFTDISPGFLENARKRFDNERLRFKVLDIEKDFKESGFEVEQYDLIVASNVLHATTNIQDTLLNVHRLLKPGGKLILFEITNLEIVRNTFVFGLLPGWWKASEDYRTWGPLFSLSQWNENLKATHFSGIDISFSDDSALSSQVCNAMISTALNIPSAQGNGVDTIEKEMVFIVDDTPLQRSLASSLCEQLVDFDFNTKCLILPADNVLEHRGLENSSCIFLPDIENPWFKDMDEIKFNILKRLVTAKQLLWVFHQDQASDLGPDRQVIMGFSRSIRSEYEEFNFVTLGLDDISEPCSTIRDIAKILKTSFFGDKSDETEYVIKKDIIQISRIVEANHLSEKLSQKSPDSEMQQLHQKERPLKMSFASCGLLDTLQFIDDETYSHALETDEVEIAVRAIGINFKDILISLGQIAETDIGVECAGIVTRLGASAAAEGRIHIGDRVACAMQGAYRTHGRCNKSRVIRIPDDMEFSTGASVLIVFATAYYCLVSIARIRRHESILIHAGAGGLGQAVIQLAKMWDADIYVTVSTEAKKKLLVDLYGIPEDHFFSSRSLAFRDGIMSMTKGRGVDIIINSLSGEALRCSWECVASLGRFIEVGRRDIDGVSVSALGGLSMRPFSQSTTFASVDLSIVLRKPDIAQELLIAVMDLAQSKKIFVPKPLHKFDASRIEEAFRFMQTGKHVGKCVVEFGEHDTVRVTPRIKPTQIFDSSATYVIAGGLGGIGRSIAKWMVEKKARYLLLLSRKRTHSNQIVDFLDNLKAKGVKVLTPQCDVTNEADLQSVLSLCRKKMPPIKGCIQASMVLKSAMFPNMQLTEFKASTRPKVEGSYNLHKYLPHALDFFIMLSSHAGILGAPAQSNYAAGNTYQDALARHRISVGEKAVAIDLGVVASVGFVAEHADIEGFLHAGGHEVMSEESLHRLLGHYCNAKLELQSDMKCQVINGLPLPSTLRARDLVEFPWLSRPLFKHLHQIENVQSSFKPQHNPSSTFIDLKTMLSTVTSLHEIGDSIADALSTKLSHLLLINKKEIDPEKPVSTYGVDSLVAIEIRTWFAQALAVDMAVFEILGSTSSVASMGILAAGKRGIVEGAGA